MQRAVPSRDQARSMVVTTYGIVATSQTLASQAGANILQAGGNAVLGVTQPYANGIGGDLFAIVYEARTGALHGLNSSGWTPAALTIEELGRRSIGAIDRIGAHAVPVPGCVAGWDELRQRFGTKTFAELLAPAIRYADSGFPLPEMAAVLWIGDALLGQPG